MERDLGVLARRRLGDFCPTGDGMERDLGV
jgi:hypothetical protein